MALVAIIVLHHAAFSIHFSSYVGFHPQLLEILHYLNVLEMRFLWRFRPSILGIPVYYMDIGDSLGGNFILYFHSFEQAPDFWRG